MCCCRTPLPPPPECDPAARCARKRLKPRFGTFKEEYLLEDTDAPPTSDSRGRARTKREAWHCRGSWSWVTPWVLETLPDTPKSAKLAAEASSGGRRSPPLPGLSSSPQEDEDAQGSGWTYATNFAARPLPSPAAHSPSPSPAAHSPSSSRVRCDVTRGGRPRASEVPLPAGRALRVRYDGKTRFTLEVAAVS